MKKLLFIFLILFAFIASAQDVSPLPSVTVKKLISPNNPTFYYNTVDSALWVFKGETGWLRIATHQQLIKYYVPYTGAIKDVNLNTHSLATSGIKLNATNPLIVSSPGEIGWNSEDGTMNLRVLNNSTLQVGQELYIYGKASENISNGDVLQFSGVQGNHIMFKKAVGSEIKANSKLIIGIATDNILNNAFGYAIWFGKINGIFTTGWNSANLLWFDPSVAGGLTNVQPSAPNAQVLMAAVIKLATGDAENGIIMVRPTFDYKMTDLSDVNGTPLSSSGQFPVWDDTNKYFDFNYDIDNYWTASQTQTYADGKVSDAAYDANWNNITTIAPSKNSVYDKINSIERISYCSSTMTVTYGTLIQGTVADLCAVGGTDVIINESAGMDASQVTFSFLNVERMSSFVFYGFYNGGSTHQYWVEAYNVNTTNWDFLGEFGNSTTNQWYSFNIFTPNSYINNGTVQIRLRHNNPGIVGHYLTLDYIDVNFGGAGGGSTIAASSVEFTPNGNMASTNVQAAIEELDIEKEPLLTKGNLTAGSSKVTIGGTGTGAVIGTGASVDVNEANLSLQNIGGAVTDAQVPNTITLDNITQITNRSHTTLSDIGTNTHAQIDTHITNDADLSITNEGQLTVAAGTANTSIINSNTSGQTGVTIGVGGINTISESGNTITITATEVPQAPTLVGNNLGLTSTSTTVDLSAYVNPTELPTPYSLTMNNSGSGDVSGSTFNGSAAKAISYNTIGAEPALTKGTFTENADGLVLSDSTRQVIGGATVLSLKAGRVIPTTTNISHGESGYTYSQIGHLPLSGGTMNNTDLVTNLNADLLDGQHGSYYAPASGSGNYIQNQFSSAQSAEMWIDGRITAGNEIKSKGSNSIVSWQDRTTLNDWGWYANNGTARLFNGIDALSVSTAGAATFASTIQATTGKFTNLNQGKVPFQNNGALEDSPIHINNTQNISFIGSSSNAIEFHIKNTEGSARDWAFLSTGSAWGGGGQEGFFNIYDKTTESQRFTIDTSGGVGIGTTLPGLVRGLDIQTSNTNGGLQLRLGADNGLYFDIGRRISDGAFSIQGNQAGANNILLAPTSGNVIIGSLASPSITSVIALTDGTLSTTTISSGATNLSGTLATSTVTINSDTGTDYTIPSATQSLSGVLNTVDKTKIDNIWVTTPQSLSGTTVTMTWTSGINASITLTGTTTLTIEGMPDGGEAQLEVTNGSSSYTLNIQGSTGYTTEVVMGNNATINTTISSHTSVIIWRRGSSLYYGFVYDN